MGDFEITMAIEEASGSSVSALDTVAAEIALFKSLKPCDLAVGIVDKKSDPSFFFFAHPSTKQRLPFHVHMAKSHFSALTMKQLRNELSAMFHGKEMNSGRGTTRRILSLPCL